MRRPGWMLVVGVVLGVTGLVAAGCSSGSDSGGGSASAPTTAASAPTTAASPTTAAAGGDEIKLTAENTSWSTKNLQFTSGAKVTVEVTNKDTFEHNFTFQEATAEKDIEGGEDATLSFTAPASGTYKFFCKYHPSAMTGSITIS